MPVGDYDFNLAKTLEERIPDFLETIERFMTPPPISDMEISRYELMTLLMLDQKKIINMSRLAQFLSIPVSTATNVAVRLDRKGLVMRLKSEEDRRAINLELTDNGKELAGHYKKYFKSIIDCMSTNLTKEESQIFAILIRKMMTGFFEV